jgi:hypothetical protein
MQIRPKPGCQSLRNVKGSHDALKGGCPDYPPIADIGELSVRGSRKPACAKSILAPPDPSGGPNGSWGFQEAHWSNLFCPGCLIIAARRPLDLMLPDFY